MKTSQHSVEVQTTKEYMPSDAKWFSSLSIENNGQGSEKGQMERNRGRDRQGRIRREGETAGTARDRMRPGKKGENDKGKTIKKISESLTGGVGTQPNQLDVDGFDN